MTFDPEAFEERAAIHEYEAGMTRFQAETKAAKAQGVTRWEAIGDVAGRLVKGAGHSRSLAGKPCQDHVPELQPHAAKEVRSMPKRQSDR